MRGESQLSTARTAHSQQGRPTGQGGAYRLEGLRRTERGGGGVREATKKQKGEAEKQGRGDTGA